MKESKTDVDTHDTAIFDIKNLIAALGKGDKQIEFKMPESTGPQVTQVMIDKWNRCSENQVKLIDITDAHEIKIQKNSTYMQEVHRKLADFALKEEMLQAQNDIKSLQGLVPLFEQHERDIEWLKEELKKLRK